jgi:glutaredoxin 2
MQSTSFTHSIILPRVPRLTLTIFPTLSHKQQDFRGKIVKHKMRVLIFYSRLPETFLIVRRIKQDILNILVHRPSCDVPATIVRF